MKKMLTKGNYSDRINFADAEKKLKKPWKCKGFRTCDSKGWVLQILKN